MPKDDAFWLSVGYLALGAIVSYVCWLTFETVGIETGWIERYNQWFNPAAVALSVLIGAVTLLILKRNKERDEYFLASIAEVRKVSWPSGDDTRRMTIIVCVVVAIFSAILSLFDVVWAGILKWIIA